MDNLSDIVERKFIDSIEIDEYEIWTDTGWQDISHIHKTVEYQEYELVLENGMEIICADDHIVFSNGKEIFVKDLKPSDRIDTESGPVLVKSIIKTDNFSHMYDVTVPKGNRFYSNGILSHNTTVATAIILHYIIFNSYKTVALLSNKAASALEIMSRIRLAFEELPWWLQQGVEVWNKGSIELENGCKCFASASSSSSIRGRSISLLYIDEAAHVNGWEEFRDSVLPTIAAGASGEDGEKSKMIYTSTPNGLNHYYYTWDAALKGKNEFKPIAADWRRHPDRDEAWRQKTLADMNFDDMKFAQEYELEFVGSSGTLITGSVLKSLEPIKPIRRTANMNQYVSPLKENTYCLVADVGEGKGLDYSAFAIFDVTQMPYKQVLTFRSNEIGVIDYASIIYEMANIYNQAYVLVEVNSIGSQVSDTLLLDYGYEQILMTKSIGNSGKRISSGFGGGRVDKGIRTTKTVKATGCSMLKNLIEQKQLEIVDLDTIQELNTFSKKGSSYEAEAGHHDDMVMPLVLFAWLTTDPFFKELSDIDTLRNLREFSDEEMLDQILPFGFINDGNNPNYHLDNLV